MCKVCLSAVHLTMKYLQERIHFNNLLRSMLDPRGTANARWMLCKFLIHVYLFPVAESGAKYQQPRQHDEITQGRTRQPRRCFMIMGRKGNTSFTATSVTN